MDIKKILLVTLFVFSLKIISYSQYFVSGLVTDSSKTALSHATVLLKENDKLFEGCITDGKGFFRIQNLSVGTYQLEIDFLGFEPYIKKLQLTNNAELGLIILKEKVGVIDSINVYGKRTNTKSEVDRIVYTVSQKEKKNAVNSYQVLANVPELQVNTLQKSVAVTGSENTLILINNIKKDNLALLSLNPKDIEKVEVITNPSTRYLSEDITSIINIVTKESIAGIKAELTEKTTPDFKTDNWSKFNIRANSKRLEFYSVGFISTLNETRSQYKSIMGTKSNTNSFEKRVNTNSNTFNMLSGEMKSGLAFSINENNYLQFDACIGGYHSKGKGNLGGRIYEDSTFKSDLLIEKDDGRTENRQEYSAYYQYSPKGTNSILSINAGFNRYTDNYNLLYDESSNNSDFRNDLSSKSNKQSYDFQANYSRNIFNLKGDFGYRLYHQLVNQKMLYKAFGDSLNSIDYKELRNYFYFNVNGDIVKNKLSFQIGLGVEDTRTNIRSESSNSKTNSYVGLLPSMGLNFNFNQKHSLKVNFLKTLDRPSVSSLNPTLRYVDSLKNESGNPYLKPSNRFKLNLKYVYSLKKLYISPSITYNLSAKNITKVGQVNADGIYLLSYKNIANYYSWEGALTLNYQFANGFKFNSNAYYRILRYNDSNNNIDCKLNTYGYFATLAYEYKKFLFYLSYIKQPEFLVGKMRGRNGDDSWTSIYWNLNSNWNLGVNLRYLSLWKSSNIINDGAYFERSEVNNFDRHLRFMIEITYSFEKGRKNQNSSKKINSTDSSEGLRL